MSDTYEAVLLIRQGVTVYVDSDDSARTIMYMLGATPEHVEWRLQGGTVHQEL